MSLDQLANDAELASRWLGRTINSKYVVQSVVGSGGMAVVYAVKHRNGKRFALKMLHRELSLNPFIRQRFVREGYVANRVEHEGAVAVIDDDITDDGSAFLVMELLHGVTLERLWDASGNRLTLECVLAIAEQLLDVLAAAHAQNIVHRDLKPANVFVTRHGVVKILDFGIARLREGDGSKTESGTTLGTPLFMPPEQASGRSRDVDHRTDLWAVGATMFSLISGEYVHDGENAAQVLIAVATTPARSLGSVAPDAPPEVAAIIDKALAFHNEDRWDSAQAMRAAILEAQAKLGLGITREFLGRIVRATAPGDPLLDIQSTPVTTPSGTERTTPSPTPFSRDQLSPPLGSAVPTPPIGMGATKRSAGNNPGATGKDLTDSSARGVTSTTGAPAFRSPSHAVIGAIVVAAVAAIGGAILAIRFATNRPQPEPPAPATASLSAAPLGSAASTATLLAPLEPAEAPQAPTEPSAALKGGLQVPLPAPRGPVRRPQHGGKLAADNVGTEEPAPAPVASPPPPAPAPPPPASTQTAPRKAPPTLDRTSPFGN